MSHLADQPVRPEPLAPNNHHNGPFSGVVPKTMAMRSNTNLVSSEYWSNLYASCQGPKTSINPILRNWILDHIPPCQGSCFEVGCFPGSFLSVFGELGYELHGIDLAPRVESDLPLWLRDGGYRVGEIRQADFLTFENRRLYDIVCSFGFIEHFTNWKDVLRKSASLVRKNGLLLVETPNYRGLLQLLTHAMLDWEGLLQHNVRAMDPRGWSRVLRGEGFSISHCGYLGGIGFGVSPRRMSVFNRLGLRMLKWIEKWVSPYLTRPCSFYSPFCGLIAKRSS